MIINTIFKKNEINNIIAFMKKDKKNLNEKIKFNPLKKNWTNNQHRTDCIYKK